MDEISFDNYHSGPAADMSDISQAEYVALRDTIRERGTARLCAVLGGFIAWAALAIALLIAELARRDARPLLVLAGTFEINFFIHTGVERIGRTQVFYEAPVDGSRIHYVAHLDLRFRIVAAQKRAASQRALDSRSLS